MLPAETLNVTQWYSIERQQVDYYDQQGQNMSRTLFYRRSLMYVCRELESEAPEAEENVRLSRMQQRTVQFSDVT